MLFSEKCKILQLVQQATAWVMRAERWFLRTLDRGCLQARSEAPRLRDPPHACPGFSPAPAHTSLGPRLPGCITGGYPEGQPPCKQSLQTSPALSADLLPLHLHPLRLVTLRGTGRRDPLHTVIRTLTAVPGYQPPGETAQ